MAFWKKQEEDAISCECGEHLVLKKEKLPKGYYYAPRIADCLKCGTHYERSPTGHLYLNHDPRGRYDSMQCAEDMGGLERVVHQFKTLFGKERWEFVVYCPRHEENPASFLDGVSELEAPFDYEAALILVTTLITGAAYRRNKEKNSQHPDSGSSE